MMHKKVKAEEVGKGKIRKMDEKWMNQSGIAFRPFCMLIKEIFMFK